MTALSQQRRLVQKEYINLQIIASNDVTLCNTKHFGALPHLIGSLRRSLDVSLQHLVCYTRNIALHKGQP